MAEPRIRTVAESACSRPTRSGTTHSNGQSNVLRVTCNTGPHNFPAEHTSHGRFVRLTRLFGSDGWWEPHPINHDASPDRSRVRTPAETCLHRPTR